MCDTLVLKKDGAVFFAKNSDREPGEAQLVVRIPAVRNDRQARLKTTYIEIDQTADRHGVILSKPFWIWGAEMGANDRGVVIGNEAVFTRGMEKTPGLIGMDLLRLGLERGDTAEHAMQVIIEMLETYGQGGICGYRDRRLRYDNSFILADSGQAWVLETAGRHWVAKAVRSAYSISNCLTIEEEYDLKSEGLEDFARQKGLFSGKGRLNFKKTFDTRFIPFFAASRHRLGLSSSRLKEMINGGSMHLGKMMNALRSHFKEPFEPAEGTNRDLCMHAGGVIRRSQTCGSMASRLTPKIQSHFFTGTSAPCLSVFKPAGFDADLGFSVLNPDAKTVAGSLWQRHEQVHRRLIFNRKAREQVQSSSMETEKDILGLFEQSGFDMNAAQLRAADRMAADWEEALYRKYKDLPFDYSMLSPYALYWRRANRLDGFAS
jgi:secernin